MLVFVISTSAALLASSVEQPVARPDVGQPRYVRDTCLNEMVSEFGLRFCGETLDAALTEFFDLFNDPSWDGYIPWELLDAHDVRVHYHEIDMSHEFRIIIDWDFSEPAPRIYIMDAYDNQLDMYSDCIPAEIMEFALDAANSKVNERSDWAMDMAEAKDIQGLSICPCNGAVTYVLRNVTSNGACSRNCFNNVRNYTRHCALRVNGRECGLLRGTRTTHDNRSHSFQINPQGHRVCVHCFWVQ